jgi:putative membrane protein
MRTQKLNKILAIIFVFFLLVGLIGMFTSFENTFKELSFFNLVFTFLLVLLSLKLEINNFIKPFLIVFAIGFIAEQIGVHTGLIFGDYSYGKSLGFRVFQVPLIIGVNWAILSFGAWHLSEYFTINKRYRFLIGGGLMVLFDLVMEPTAIALNYWNWALVEIPLYNYISWFGIGFIAMFIYSKFPTKTSGITKIVFISQFIFFIILSLKFTCT